MGFSGKNPTDSSPTIVSEKGIPNKSTTKPQPTPPQVIFWKKKSTPELGIEIPLVRFIFGQIS